MWCAAKHAAATGAVVDSNRDAVIDHVTDALAGYSVDVATHCSLDTGKIVDDAALAAALDKSGSITDIVSVAGEMASALSAVIPFVGGALKLIAWAADRYASLTEARALLRGSVKLTRRAKHVVDSGAPLFEGDETEYRKVVVQLMAFFACIERSTRALSTEAGLLSRGKEWIKARAFDANTLRKGATLERDAHHLWQQTVEFAACLSMGSIATAARPPAPVPGTGGESDRLEIWWKACRFKEDHGLRSFVCLMRKYLTKPCADAPDGAWISPEVWDANARCFEDELASVDCDEDGKVSLTEVALVLDQEWAGPESSDMPILQVFAERLMRAVGADKATAAASPAEQCRDDLAHLRSLLRAGESTVLTGHEDLAYHLEQYEEGTREWVYGPLEAWAMGSHDDQSDAMSRLMWISGPAGMGKSVIAAKLMEKYGLKAKTSSAAMSEGQMTIAAAFFCKHNDSRRRSARQVIASLAYQLCVAYEGMRAALSAALSGKQASEVADDISGTSGMSVQDLFELLLAGPMSHVVSEQQQSSAGRPGPILILIDALDEIEQGPDRKSLLSLVGSQLTKLPAGVKCMVTSRLEVDITESLQGKPSLLLGSEGAMAEQQQRDLRMVIERRIVMQVCSEVVTEDLEAKRIVVESLEAASEGVFVWVKLAAQALHDAKASLSDVTTMGAGLSEEQVATVLRGGLDLDALYEENFRRVWEHIRRAAGVLDVSITTGMPMCLEAVVDDPEADAEFLTNTVRRILAVLVAASEPIHVDHLPYLALGSDTTRQSGRLLTRCVGLLSTVFKTTGLIQGIHKSVYDWLKDMKRSGVYWWMRWLGMLCWQSMACVWCDIMGRALCECKIWKTKRFALSPSKPECMTLILTMR